MIKILQLDGTIRLEPYTYDGPDLAYEFQYMDSQESVQPIETFFASDGWFFDDSDESLDESDFKVIPNNEHREIFIQGLRGVFAEAGWEGDGTIGVVWLPSFLYGDMNDGTDCYVFHVKQSNNGTSFLTTDPDLWNPAE